MYDTQYFYVRPEDVASGFLILCGNEARHCVQVLRKKKGDACYAVDGLGHEFAVVLESVEKNEVRARIEGTKERPRELPFFVTLAAALIKHDHFDWLVEKATELGVSRIVPMITERSLPDAGPSKIARWHKIALSAMKQSRRSVLPEVSESARFTTVVKKFEGSGFVCHETAERPIGELIVPGPVTLLVGPEGGFTESEFDQACKAGFQAVSLGSRRLRAETAAIAALSVFSTLGSPKSQEP